MRGYRKPSCGQEWNWERIIKVGCGKNSVLEWQFVEIVGMLAREGRVALRRDALQQLVGLLVVRRVVETGAESGEAGHKVRPRGQGGPNSYGGAR